MAKGDDSRSRNRVEQQSGTAQNNLTNLRQDTTVPQNQAMWNNYTGAVDQDRNTAQGLMSGYQDFLGQNPYGQFIENGGYSPQDVASLRARSVSPTRAVYANANREVDRSRALQGGNTPGFGVLKARMAREQSQAISDANTNTEAGLAQMVNEGKRFGTQGEVGRQLQTRGQMNQLYGTTPGQSSMFGNQVLESTNQRLQDQQLQNQLSLGTMNAQIAASQLPGKMDSALNQIKSVSEIAKNVGGTIYPWAQ